MIMKDKSTMSGYLQYEHKSGESDAMSMRKVESLVELESRLVPL